MKRIPEPEFMDDPLEAEAYAKADFSEVNLKFVEKLLTLVPINTNLLALELGTGPADITQRVAQARPSCKIIGIDASFPMLRLGHKYKNTSTAFLLADAKQLPFSSKKFDVIFSNSILHHIQDTHAFWTELYRVAKSGCIVFLRDLFRPPTKEDAQKIVDTYASSESKLLQEEFYRSLLAAFTPDEIQQQLNLAGLASFLKIAYSSDRHVDVWGILL